MKWRCMKFGHKRDKRDKRDGSLWCNKHGDWDYSCVRCGVFIQHDCPTPKPTTYAATVHVFDDSAQGFYTKELTDVKWASRADDFLHFHMKKGEWVVRADSVLDYTLE